MPTCALLPVLLCTLHLHNMKLFVREKPETRHLQFHAPLLLNGLGSTNTPLSTHIPYTRLRIPRLFLSLFRQLSSPDQDL